MKFALTLTFISLLCTCGRAQNGVDQLPRVLTSVAFIKGKTGFLIDSLTIRTTLDTVPYGFAFPNDTILLDISIFRPADELTLETFARGYSFGRRSCWVDAPTADVYLSINSGLTTVDSVGLSPIDRIYRQEVAKVKTLPSLPLIKKALIDIAYNHYDLLFAADFLNAYADMPNLNRQDVSLLKFTLRESIGSVKKHPRFAPILRKNKLMGSLLPGKLRKYGLSDAAGQPAAPKNPKDSSYVLHIYDSSVPACRRDHKLIAKYLAEGGLLTGIRIIGISGEEDVTNWQHYVRQGAFSWAHYHEGATSKKKLTTKMGLYPAGTYVLINDNNLIEGVYDDITKLAAALVWRENAKDFLKSFRRGTSRLLLDKN